MFKKFRGEKRGDVVGYIIVLWFVVSLLWVYAPKIKEVTFGSTNHSTAGVEEVTKPIDKTTKPPVEPTNPTPPPIIEEPKEELKFCALTKEDSFYTTKPSGYGTEDSPYLISNSNELQWLQHLSKDKTVTCYAKQTNSIDASSTKTWDGGKGFDPIGKQGDGFNIRFDGNGYNIRNLYINRPSENYVGLFGYLEGTSSLSNINLNDVYVNGSSFTGALAGYVQKESEANHVYIDGKVNGIDDTGGIFGRFRGKALHYVTARVDVIGDEHVGGIAGLIRYTDVAYAESKGTAKGINRVGGIVGSATDIKIKDSFSRVETFCNSSCPYGEIGGAFGYLELANVVHIYSTGKINATNALKGGLIGSGKDNVITNSYWDIGTSGISSSYGGTGKSTVDMKKQSTFVNWGFDNVWGMNVSYNDGYPIL